MFPLNILFFHSAEVENDVNTSTLEPILYFKILSIEVLLSGNLTSLLLVPLMVSFVLSFNVFGLIALGKVGF